MLERFDPLASWRSDLPEHSLAPRGLFLPGALALHLEPELLLACLALRLLDSLKFGLCVRLGLS